VLNAEKTGTATLTLRAGAITPFAMNPSELHRFYEEFVGKLRDRGVVCAITSGLACVHYGMAETTKDCDLLCHPGSFSSLLDLLGETQVNGVGCIYRGNISPPLDPRWHAGGWTSHFEWTTKPTAVVLDVFGHALRESSPWERQLVGLYANPHTVAEMKRTNRDKDWPFITALGVRMVEADDDRGWLHIYNGAVLLDLISQYEIPSVIADQRPALGLALNRDPRTEGALNAERKLWEELDRRRIRMLERHLRPYVSAVRKARFQRELSLLPEHELRIECATRHLPCNPLKDYGIERFIGESRDELVKSGLIPELGLTWLPDVAKYFTWLNP
jgi:hypothetical protein